MPVAIEFTVLGETQLQRVLMRFSARTLNAIPVFVQLMKAIESQVEEQFDSEGARGSGGWDELAPATIEFKRRNGYPLEILHRTLTLRNSLTKTMAPGAIRRIDKQSMTFGSSVKYGIFHQKGAPKANLPQRRPVEFTESDRQDYATMIQRYVVTGKTMPV